MLVVLSTDLGVGLERAAQLAAVYALFYGLGQPLWGIVSDRLGRVGVLRIALLGAALGSLASMLVPGEVPLLIARGFTGLMVGALYPMLITLVGDTMTGAGRYREISNLQTVSALGTTVATLAAGALASWLDWRVVFGVTLVGSAAAFVALLGTGNGRPEPSAGRLLAALRAWPLYLYGLAFFEGAVLLGTLTYIVPAMEHAGVPVALAGVLAATYGIGIVVGSRLVNRVAARTGRPVVVAIGGAFLVAGYLLAALLGDPATLAVTALLVGLSNSFMHSSIQGWATAVAPSARATTVSFFATSMFVGAGVATGISARTAASGDYRTIFILTAAFAVLVAAAAAISFARWLRTHSMG